MTNTKSVKIEISVTPYVPVETKDKMEVWEAFRKNLFNHANTFSDVRTNLLSHEMRKLIFWRKKINDEFH